MDDDDIKELKLIFLDECLENIELLEQGLMQMGEGQDCEDTLNEVFRAAHSIKGGAATFGFQPMSEITHYMETLLDEMRSGRRSVTEDDVDLLLTGLDIVQHIQQEGRVDSNADHDERNQIQKLLDESVEKGKTTDQASASDGEQAETASKEAISEQRPPAKLGIAFVPNREFIRRGNDPLLLIREISRRGELETVLDLTSVPEWSAYDPSASYLSWQLELFGTSTKEDIREIFEWVDTDCDVQITDISPAETIKTGGEKTAAVSQTENSLESVPESGVTSQQSSTSVAENKESTTESKKATTKNVSGGGEASSIRIATDKIDQLINLVGELVITQSMLSRVSDPATEIDMEELRERMADLEHNTRDLQESVMQVRMLPLSSAFSRLPRLVRDLSKKLNKEVELVVEGGSTELDKTVLERMVDPLVHLVRNALDHGLETPDKRANAGKPRAGRLLLNARQESGSVVIEISDDGNGIDAERVLSIARNKGIVSEEEELSEDQINQLIFAPGFSTAEQVSDVSGRGVGMDVVRRNILDLGGRVQVHSVYGSGTKIEINLPLSLAILDGQLIRIADQVFVIPILSIIETLEIRQTNVSDVPGTGEVCLFRGEYLSMVRIADQFRLPGDSPGRLIVVVDTHGRREGLVIDEVLGQQQVVIKPLDKNYKNVPGLAGATIMSDGSVALILDPANISEHSLLANAA
ncbi:MAG: chemotaxis protein CheA [Granulosicoccaceae bacterium]